LGRSDAAVKLNADAQQLAEGKRAFADNQRRAEAAWKQMKTEAGNRLYNEQQALENNRQQRADETVLADAIIVDLKAEKMDDRSRMMEKFEYDKAGRPAQWEEATRDALKTAWKTFWDVTQFSLDVAGFVPFYGEICDGINGCIYLMRGNKIDAGISFVAAAPFVGNLGALARLGKAASLGKRFSKFVKFGGNFVDAARWMRGASKVDKLCDFSKICKMDIPACFVGDIHIVMAGRPAATIDPAPIDATPITAGPNWLSGDDVVQTLVHSLDKAAWAMHEQPPAKAWGMGGRSSCFEPKFGDTFDHHAVVYEYPGGVRVYGYCRDQNGCYGETSDKIFGTKGRCNLSKYRIEGETNWRYKGAKAIAYDIEHQELFASIRAGKPINNGLYMVRSTMLAILGRIVCYTGQSVTWDQAMASGELPGPECYAWDADPPVKPDENGRYPIPIPGITKFS
jgi:hypothetical protein